MFAATALTLPAPATILWSDQDARLVHHTDKGYDILGGAVKRDDTASDTLYFKFHVNPLSDVATEEYFAAFQLFESSKFRLAVGNAPEAWGYSAFYTSETGPSNKLAGEFNLASAKPEAAGLGVFKPYELPRHDHERTIVFKVQYLPGGDDLITVWLSPNLSRGATVENQPEILTTKFKANASFNQIRLRHGGNGNGWIFSDMAIATSFSDFIVQRFWQTWWFATLTALAILPGALSTVKARVNWGNRLRGNPCCSKRPGNARASRMSGLNWARSRWRRRNMPRHWTVIPKGSNYARRTPATCATRPTHWPS